MTGRTRAVIYSHLPLALPPKQFLLLLPTWGHGQALYLVTFTWGRLGLFVPSGAFRESYYCASTTKPFRRAIIARNEVKRENQWAESSKERQQNHLAIHAHRGTPHRRFPHAGGDCVGTGVCGWGCNHHTSPLPLWSLSPPPAHPQSRCPPAHCCAGLSGGRAGAQAPLCRADPAPRAASAHSPLCPPQPIDYEGFRLFMKTYLEAEVPEELCQHLFTSFKRKSCQAAPETQRQSPSVSQLGEPAWPRTARGRALQPGSVPSALPAPGRTELHGAKFVFQSPSRLMPASPSRPRWPALLSQVPRGAIGGASTVSPPCGVCSMRRRLLREHVKLQKQ